VYNLTVEGTHTYLVGESGVLVHNAYDNTAKYGTYIGTNNGTGKIDYVGITKNFDARSASHKATRSIKEFSSKSGYRQARALEHSLIQELGSRGYKLANKQRGIGRKGMHKNTKAQWAWAGKEAKRFLDELNY